MITGKRKPALLAIVPCLAAILPYCVLANEDTIDKPLVAAETESFIGRVAKVISGDQIEIILPSGTRIVANLAGLKAPASSSVYASLSRQWLAGQLEGQLVSAECAATDSAQFDCAIFPDDRHINVVSLFHGLSVCDGQGSVLHDSAFYKQYEKMAQENQSGIWQQSTADSFSIVSEANDN